MLDTNTASPGASIPPHLNVTVSWTELVTQATRTREKLCVSCGQAVTGRAAGAQTARGHAGTQAGLLATGGPVFTETGGRVPRSLLRRLACDSAITRVVFGPDGAVLDVGRAQRTVTGQMRRAVIARDRHCVFPGCDQPPSRCEVHHAVTHWADGGDTSVGNSALLCWYHHQLVDARGISMRWSGKRADGAATGALLESGWTFTDARGVRISLPEAVDSGPAEARPADSRPVEAQPAEARPADSDPARGTGSSGDPPATPPAAAA